ncbi:MAG: UvrB/UvrC motif-containing protein [Planctomycetota bacterium]|nr:UvrB/UvrC motif-containing protein [Planctomycetota bacterium]
MADSDLTRFLSHWPRTTGEFQVRELQADDGRMLLQVRIDLGVIQMEAEGRPDGQRPGGHRSLVDAAADRSAREDGPLVLDAQECRAVRDEAVQFYHRYVAFFNLNRFEAVIRDADHALRCLDLCRDHAGSEDDRRRLEHLRPQVFTMKVRAAAELAMSHRQPRAAMAAIDQGLSELEELLGPDAARRSNEVHLLRGMREMLVPKLPSSQRVELEERLQAALDDENYELAAILRDELRMMKD